MYKEQIAHSRKCIADYKKMKKCYKALVISSTKQIKIWEKRLREDKALQLEYEEKEALNV